MKTWKIPRISFKNHNFPRNFGKFGKFGSNSINSEITLISEISAENSEISASDCPYSRSVEIGYMCGNIIVYGNVIYHVFMETSNITIYVHIQCRAKKMSHGHF